jgi:hypothetical protein
VFDDEDVHETTLSPIRSLASSKIRRAVQGPQVQSDCKLDLVFEKLALIENQNSEILSNVEDIEIRVAATVKKLGICAN